MVYPLVSDQPLTSRICKFASLLFLINFTTAILCIICSNKKYKNKKYKSCKFEITDLEIMTEIIDPVYLSCDFHAF